MFSTVYGTDLCLSPDCEGCGWRQPWPGASVGPAGGRRGWSRPPAPPELLVLWRSLPGELGAPGLAPSRPWRARGDHQCRTRPGPTRAPGRPLRPSWSPWRGGADRPAAAAAAAGGEGDVCNQNIRFSVRLCLLSDCDDGSNLFYCLILLARISLECWDQTLKYQHQHGDNVIMYRGQWSYKNLIITFYWGVRERSFQDRKEVRSITIYIYTSSNRNITTFWCYSNEKVACRNRSYETHRFYLKLCQCFWHYQEI